MRTTISIIKKFSATIKYLRFESHFLSMSDFLEILSFVPNAEHLVFESLSTEQSYRAVKEPPQKKRRIESNNEDLKLLQLKILTFKDCKDEFLAVFNRLPAGLLRELKLDNLNLDDLKVLFKRQTNIKKLIMKGFIDHFQRQFMPLIHPQVAPDIFDSLQLESIEWRHNAYNSNIDTILSKQTKLKSLKLLDERVNEDLMNVIVNQLTELEIFSMNVSKPPVAAFVNIKKLKNLKDLTLRSDEDRSMTPFEQFAQLDNSRITTLDMRYIIDMSVELISALAKSVPNLKVLRFSCDSDYRIFNAIMTNFNFVEVLQFDPFATYFNHYQQNDVNNHLMQGGCFNPNLIELSVNYTLPYKRPFLKKLIADYPNLKKLVLESMYPFTAPQFRLILNGFSKMQSLTFLSGASKLKIDDLDYIKEHKNNLKFISLEDLEIKITARLKKKLSTVFDVVHVNYGLSMAVDRKTMNSERQ